MYADPVCPASCCCRFCIHSSGGQLELLWCRFWKLTPSCRHTVEGGRRVQIFMGFFFQTLDLENHCLTLGLSSRNKWLDVFLLRFLLLPGYFCYIFQVFPCFCLKFNPEIPQNSNAMIILGISTGECGFRGQASALRCTPHLSEEEREDLKHKNCSSNVGKLLTGNEHWIHSDAFNVAHQPIQVTHRDFFFASVSGKIF